MISRKKYWSVLLFLSILLPFSALAETFVFTGVAGDEDWSNIINWDRGGIPSTSDNVVINNVVRYNSAGNTLNFASITINPEGRYICGGGGSSLSSPTVSGDLRIKEGAGDSALFCGATATTFIFERNTALQTSVTGNAIFYDGSLLSDGSVSGNAIFYGTAGIGSGSVGSAEFRGSGTNGGTVNGNAYFSCDAYKSGNNSGTVLGVTTVESSCQSGNTFYFNGGAADEDWGNSANWTNTLDIPNAIPGIIDDVILNSRVAQNTAQSFWGESIRVSSLTIEAGGQYSNATGGLGQIIAGRNIVVNAPGDSALFAGATAGETFIFNGSSYQLSGTGNAIFRNGGGLNDGSISGHAKFYDTSGILSGGVGSAEFFGSGTNGGTVNGNAYFSCDAYYNGNNGGLVLGTTTVEEDCAQTFYWFQSGSDDLWSTVTNNWWLDSGHTMQAPFVPRIRDNVIIQGSTAPRVDLTNAWAKPASLTSGSVGIVFESSGIFSDLDGIAITGNVTFNGGVRFGGQITGNARFNDTSYPTSFAQISGSASFENAVSGVMTVPNNTQWSGGVAGSYLSTDETTPINSWIFQGNSIGTGALNGNATFNNTSSMVGGSISGNVLLNDSSFIQDSIITGNVTYNSTYFGPVPTGNQIIINSGRWSGTYNGVIYRPDGVTPITTLVLNNSSILSIGRTPTSVVLNGSSRINQNGTITGNVTYNSTYFGPVPTSNTLEISGSERFSGIVLGNRYASNGTTIITNYIFRDTSLLELGNSIVGTGEFHNSSDNLGVVNGNASFRNYSSNLGTVTGNGTFYDCSTNNGGTVNGSIINLKSCAASASGGQVISDLSSPIFSNIVVTPSTNNIHYSFNLNENAVVQVYWTDAVTNVGMSQMTINTQLNHTATISNLVSCHRYHYTLQARDASQNISTYNGSILTLGCSEGELNNNNKPEANNEEDGEKENAKNNDDVVGNEILPDEENPSPTPIQQGGGVAWQGNREEENRRRVASRQDENIPVQIVRDNGNVPQVGPEEGKNVEEANMLVSSVLDDGNTPNGNGFSILGAPIRKVKNLAIQKFGKEKVDKTVFATKNALSTTMKETVVVATYSVKGVIVLFAAMFVGLNIMVYKSIWTVYRVQEGDTLESVANRFNMFKSRLKSKNKLVEATEILTPGMELRVRNRAFLDKNYLNQLEFVLKNFVEKRKYILPTE